MNYYDYRSNVMKAMILLNTLGTKDVEVHSEEMPYKEVKADKIDDAYNIHEYKYSKHGTEIILIEFQFFLPLKKPDRIRSDWAFRLNLFYIPVSNGTNNINYAGYYKFTKSSVVKININMF